MVRDCWGGVELQEEFKLQEEFDSGSVVLVSSMLSIIEVTVFSYIVYSIGNRLEV